MAEALKKIDYTVLQQCMHCGMCLPTCPTYDTTLRERSSPRGRIALMRAVADEELEVGEEFTKEMDYCLGCLACQSACPAGVDYAHLFESARAAVVEEGASRTWQVRVWRWLVLKQLFMKPRLLRGAGSVMRMVQKSGAQKLARKLGLTRILPEALARLDPQTPEFQKPKKRTLSDKTRKYRVAVLTGCVQDLIYPEINDDTIAVLEANDCEVFVPDAQPCCGSLHAHNGEQDLAKLLARRQIELFPPDKFDVIISNAGGCGSHLKHYGRLLDGEEDAVLWDQKLRDIHQWLDVIGCRKPKAMPYKNPTLVTYHDSCHLRHGQKVVSQPRDLLKLLPGVSLIELVEADWCCGSAGVYSITQPEQAGVLLERKMKHVEKSGAEVLATANPGCHLQLVNGMREKGLSMDVVHPMNLLAQAYRNESLQNENG